MILLFDAANTIIQKPSFFTKFSEVLNKHDYSIDINQLIHAHKLLSEVIVFPDRTSKEFYNGFNKELLYSLGIISTASLLDEIFTACSYLPWETFDDVQYLKEIQNKKAILSNFHNGLNDIVQSLLPGIFDTLVVSELENVRKPDIAFFERALEKLNANASDIIYFGDSIKLDIEPATKIGIRSYLIDRSNYFTGCKNRIRSFNEIKNIL